MSGIRSCGGALPNRGDELAEENVCGIERVVSGAMMAVFENSIGQ